MKSQRLIERYRQEDRLSDLPDFVLLHIMKFMNTKEAVQTCVLSQRWKSLWKRLPELTLHSSDFIRLADFENFVSRILTCRDNKTSLHSLDFRRHGCINPKLMHRVMRYAVLHNVQQLTFHANLDVIIHFKLPSCIFRCQSLTFLKLSVRGITRRMVKFPKSLELPALKTLHLVSVAFTASDNDFADPFSTCKMLETLIINHCALQSGTKVLRISHSRLSSLTLLHALAVAQKIALSTPNLGSLAIIGDPIYQLNACNVSFLEKVYISCSSANFPKIGPVLISWLHGLANNVEIMTICSRVLENVFSTLDSGSAQPPCFGRLKSLKVRMKPYPNLSDEGISRAAAYLLQNSPQVRVDIINLE